MKFLFAEGNRCKDSHNMAWVPAEHQPEGQTGTTNQTSSSDSTGNPFFEGLRSVQSAANTAAEITTFIDSVKTFLAYKESRRELVADNFIARVEDLVLFILSLSNASGMQEMLIDTIRYLRTFCTGSICMTVQTILCAHMQSLELQSGESEDISLLDVLRDWRVFQGHPIAKFISDLMGVVFILIGAPDKNSTVINELLSVLGVNYIHKNIKAESFLDAASGVLEFTQNRILPALQAGDLSMLSYSDDDLRSIEERYSSIMATKAYVSTGRLELINLENGAFANDAVLSAEIAQLVKELGVIIRKTKNEFIKATCTRYMYNLQSFYTTLDLERMNNPLKKQPFAFKIFGGSSVGKTYLSNILLKHCAAAMNIPFNAETVCYQNASEDNFDSNYKSKHLVYSLDDVSNAKKDVVKNSPLDRLLRVINMMPACALKAGVDDKGTTPYRAELAAVTTNVRDLDAAFYSNEPAAMLRRFNVHIDVEIREEWLDEAGIPKENAFDAMYPEAYRLNLYKIWIERKSLPGKNATAHQPAKWGWKPISLGIGIKEAIKVITDMASSWADRQSRAVSRANEIFTEPLCEHNWMLRGCEICNRVETVESDDDDDASFMSLNKCEELDTGLEVQNGGDPDLFLFGPLDGPPDTNYDEDEFDFEPIEMSLTQAVKSFYEQHRVACDMFAFATAILAVLKLGQMWTSRKEQPVLQAHQEIELSKLEKTENVWKKVVREPLPRSSANMTTSLKDLCIFVKRHLGIFEYVPLYGDVTKPNYTLAMPYRENLWLVPYHAVASARKLRVTIRYGDPHSVGRKRGNSVIDTNCWRRVGSYDLALVRIIGAGDVPNMAKFLGPRGGTVPDRAMCIWRTFNGDINDAIIPLAGTRNVKFRFHDTSLSGEKIQYGELPAGFGTYKGLCMMPLISVSSRPTIFGFHIGGSNDGSDGVAEFCDADAIKVAYDELSSSNKFRVVSTGDFPDRRMNVNLEVTKDVHPKHCTNFMPSTPDEYVPHSMQVFGSHNMGVAKFKSRVDTSPICDSVEKVFSRPRDTGPPQKAPAWRDFQRDMEAIAKTDVCFDTEILDIVHAEIVDHFIEVIKDLDTSYVKPLPLEYAINGVDGVKGFEKLDRSTSPGRPLSGSKGKFMQPCEHELDGVTEPWEFRPDSGFYEDYHHTIDCYLSGERNYLLFSSTLKDEPTKFTKDKRRIFSSCPVVGTVLIRQYFLPVIKLIQDNWMRFGSAVGINAQGHQWHELYQTLCKHGEDRIVAGDYKAFDKGAHSEFTLRGMYVFYAIAEKCGYSSHDLAVMRGLITDCVYPIYDWYGVFVQFCGSNPSGIPITVHLNNMVNLQYVLYSFVAMDKSADKRSRAHEFWQLVEIFLYGDDNIMSVSREEKLFNHTSLQDELGKIGVVYTMADKISESVPFVHITQADFLKRGFRKHENGYCTAPLAVESLFKSLYNVMRPKRDDILPECSAAQAAYASVLEAYQHGQGFFNDWRHKMSIVVETPCPNIQGYTVRQLLPNQSLPTWEQCDERYTETCLELQSGSADLSDDVLVRIAAMLVEVRLSDCMQTIIRSRYSMVRTDRNILTISPRSPAAREKRLYREAMSLLQLLQREHNGWNPNLS